MISVSAEIVGNVWKLLVAEGQIVAAGEPVAIMETMKMEIPVAAPTAGRVARVLVHEGDIVQEGAALVELEPSEASATVA